MLQGYQIQNFKAFRESGTIPIRPITLIYGPNSSGKSSILQSILLLKQTLDETKSNSLLVSHGEWVDIGNVREFIHEHNRDRDFSFRFMFKDKSENNLGIKIAFHQDPDSSKTKLSSIDLFQDKKDLPVCRYSQLETGELAIDKFYLDHPFWQQWWKENAKKIRDSFFRNVKSVLAKWNIQTISSRQKQKISDVLKQRIDQLQQERDASQEPDQQFLDCQDDLLGLIELDQRIKSYDFDLAIEDLQKASQIMFIENDHFLPFNITPYTIDDAQEITTAFHLFQLYEDLKVFDCLAELTSNIHQQSINFLKKVSYIAPLRDSPKRLYTFGDMEELGKSGAGLGDILFRDQAILDRANEWFKKFNIDYTISVDRFQHFDGNLSDIFSLRLTDNLTQVNVSLLDVGFGISQVLPILVQCLASQHKTILIEQPEVHIHPRLQTEVGSLFAECIKPPFNNRFIIETHSEHLMLRLQKLIRNGELNLEDISVIYVDRTADGAKCMTLRLDEEGYFIDEWPHGFFEEGYKERFS